MAPNLISLLESRIQLQICNVQEEFFFFFIKQKSVVGIPFYLLYLFCRCILATVVLTKYILILKEYCFAHNC